MEKEERDILHLYLIRHGETASKNPNLIYGHNKVDLSLNGRKQMKILSKTINGHVQYIFTSPIERAFESGQILSNGKIPIEAKDELKEINFGTYNGEDVTKYPDLFIDKYKSKLLASKPFPNGESINQLKKRILKFHNFLLKNNFSSVCIISHQWALNAYLKLLVESNFEKGANFIFQTGKITHLKISKKNKKVRFMAHNIDYFDTYK